METGLRGKRVLVTGASGGIGSACVAAFLAEGAEVVAHYNLGRERAEALGAAQLVQGDLTREGDADRMFEEAGTLDACAVVASTKAKTENNAPKRNLGMEQTSCRGRDLS